MHTPVCACKRVSNLGAVQPSDEPAALGKLCRFQQAFVIIACGPEEWLSVHRQPLPQAPTARGHFSVHMHSLGHLCCISKKEAREGRVGCPTGGLRLGAAGGGWLIGVVIACSRPC